MCMESDLGAKTIDKATTVAPRLTLPSSSQAGGRLQNDQDAKQG